MKTRLATLYRTFSNGDHLTNTEMSALHQVVSKTNDLLHGLGLSFITRRGIIETEKTLVGYLTSRKVTFTIHNGLRQRQDELAEMLATAKAGGQLPDDPQELIGMMEDASQAMLVLAPDGVISAHLDRLATLLRTATPAIAMAL